MDEAGVLDARSREPGHTDKPIMEDGPAQKPSVGRAGDAAGGEREPGPARRDHRPAARRRAPRASRTRRAAAASRRRPSAAASARRACTPRGARPIARTPEAATEANDVTDE